MLKLLVWVDDLSSGEDLELTLPCDLSMLDPLHEYEVVDMSRGFVRGGNVSLSALNQALRRIEDCQPEATVEWVSALLEASGCLSVTDEEFLTRIENEDYFITDLSECDGWVMRDEEKAACYLATELGIPFAPHITAEILDTIKEDLIDYIDWENIWYGSYEFMGFYLIHSEDFLYIVQW